VGDIFDEPRELVRNEILELKESGYDVEEAEKLFSQYLWLERHFHFEDARYFFYTIFPRLRKKENFRYIEPSELENIMKESDFEKNSENIFSEDCLLDKIYGGWLGRAAGCTLGKPTEGFTRGKIFKYLFSTDQYPLLDYIDSTNIKEIKQLDPLRLRATKGKIDGTPRDDDMDFSIVNLICLEKKGKEFTSADVGNTWLENLPYYLVYTAERVVYKNLVNGFAPPESAKHINPYREWIGAQIRADMFGWISPGNPYQAAKLAFKDASLSHTKNGIYGEMFVAAMIATAFVNDNPIEIVKTGMKYIPTKSRLYEAVKYTMEIALSNDNWEKVWDIVMEKYGGYHTVHTINNAAIVVLSLICGKGNFEKSIAIAVQSGLDTDCNSATVGSIVGVIKGAKVLPSKFIEPLHDRLDSYIPEFANFKISELAKRTLYLIESREERKGGNN
jgi:ADP-ribosylglycohydrolase